MVKQTRASSTDRDKKATRPIGTQEEVSGEEFEPGVVTVEDEVPAFCFDLCEPGVLRCQGGCCIALGEVEDEV